MASNRPTEASWDTDEEELLDYTPGLNAFSSERDDDVDEEIDEDVLLASDDEGERVEKLGFYTEAEDGSMTMVPDLLEDDVLEVYAPDDIDQQDLDQDNQGEPEIQVHHFTQSTEDDRSQNVQIQVLPNEDEKEVVQNTSQITESSFDITQSPAKVLSDDESEDEEDSDKSTRGRFKSERIGVITSIAAKKSRSTTEIPDTLVLSKEDQNTIDTFLPGQRGGRGRGYSGPHRGQYGGQSRPPNPWDNHRGYMRPQGGRGPLPHHNRMMPSHNFNNNARQLPTAPSGLLGMPVVQQPPSKILINPHFIRGGTRPNTSWAPPKTFAEPLLNTPMGNQRFGQPVRQFRAPEPRLQLQPGHPPAQAPLVPQQTPRYELIQEALRQRQPAQHTHIGNVGWGVEGHPLPTSRYQQFDSQPQFRSQHPAASHQQQRAPVYTHAGQPRPEFRLSTPNLPYQGSFQPGLSQQPLPGHSPPRPLHHPQGNHFLDKDERIHQSVPPGHYQGQHQPSFGAPRSLPVPPHQGIRPNLPQQQQHHPQPNPQPLPRPGLSQNNYSPHHGKFGQNPGVINRQPEAFRPPGPAFGGTPPRQNLPSQPQPYQPPVGQPIQTLVKRSPSRPGPPQPRPQAPVHNRLGNTNLPPNKPPAMKPKPKVTKEELEHRRKLQDRAMRFSGQGEVKVAPAANQDKVKLGVKRASPLVGSVEIQAKQPRLETKTPNKPLSTATKAANLRLAKARVQLQKAQGKINTNPQPAASKPPATVAKPSPKPAPPASVDLDVDEEYARKLEEQKRMRQELLERKRRNRLAQASKGVTPEPPTVQKPTTEVIASVTTPTNPGHPLVQHPLVQRGRGGVRGRGMARGRGVSGRGRGQHPTGQNPSVNPSVLRQVSLDPTTPEVQSQVKRQVTPPTLRQVPIGGRRVVQNTANGATSPRTVQPPGGAMRHVIPVGSISPETPSPRQMTGSRRIVVGHAALSPQGTPVLRQVQLDGVAATTNSAKFLHMAQKYGPVQSVRSLPSEKKAIIVFQQPQSAATFVSKCNRIMVDMAIITASLI